MGSGLDVKIFFLLQPAGVGKGLPLLWLVLFTTTFCNLFRIDF